MLISTIAGAAAATRRNQLEREKEMQYCMGALRNAQAINRPTKDNIIEDIHDRIKLALTNFSSGFNDELITEQLIKDLHNESAVSKEKIGELNRLAYELEYPYIRFREDGRITGRSIQDILNVKPDIQITQLRTRVNFALANFKRGFNDEPVTEQLIKDLHNESAVPKEKIGQLNRLAYELEYPYIRFREDGRITGRSIQDILKENKN